MSSKALNSNTSRKVKKKAHNLTKTSTVHSLSNPKIKKQVTDPIPHFQGKRNESIQEKTNFEKDSQKSAYSNFSSVDTSSGEYERQEAEIQDTIDLSSDSTSESAKEYIKLKKIDGASDSAIEDKDWDDFTEEFSYETKMLKNDLQDLKIHAEYVGKSLLKKLSTYAAKKIKANTEDSSEVVRIVADNIVELERNFLSDIKAPNDILRETDEIPH